MEKGLRRGLVLSDGDLTPFFMRPISAVLWITIALVIALRFPPVRRLVARALPRRSAWPGRRRPPLRPPRNAMSTVRLGIIMNGVTGRMGTNQHLVRSICAIREQGGVALADGRRVMPDPILVGRNRDKLAALARAHGVERVTTDLDAALRNPRRHRVLRRGVDEPAARTLIRKAIAAGKHIYTEKPIAPTLAEALDLAQRGRRRAGVKHGVVQDKLCLPGLLKLRMLRRLGLLRPHPVGARRVRLLGVRGRLAAGAAPVVELPHGGRRRHHRRHVVPLALRARQPVRRE